MKNGIGSLPELTHQIYGTKSDTFTDDAFDAVFHTRLGLDQEARKTFLKRLNAALAEKGFPVFGEVDLDNQELGVERRKVLKQGFYESIQEKLTKDNTISQLGEIVIPGAENQNVQIIVLETQIGNIVRTFGNTGNISDKAGNWMIPEISFSIGGKYIELSIIQGKGTFRISDNNIYDERIVFTKGFDVISILGRKNEYVFEFPGNLDEVLDFLKKPASEISEIIQRNGIYRKDKQRKKWEEKGYEVLEDKLDGEDIIKEEEFSGEYFNKTFLNTTALSPVSHIRNRVYDLTQDIPPEFPMSQVVEDILGKIEIDISKLIEQSQFI